MRFAVDPWDPSYGSSFEVEPGPSGEPSTVAVRADVELPVDRWRPLAPPPDTEVPEAVVFVDGVRRLEARVWIETDAGDAEPGIFATHAAGAVRCAREARLLPAEVGRGLYSASARAADVDTTVGRFGARATGDSTPEQLSLALQHAMTEAEVRVAERARRAGDEPIVVDGPLRHRGHLSGTIGFVKTHHVRYLPAELDGLVGGLGPGERTPVFLLTSAWSRHSWYLRLPGPPGGPWAGVVRCEASAGLGAADVVALAHRIAALLPRFASEPHKDARAPQNLYPIAGLERELRRRLGDPAVVYRALRRAATRRTPDETGPVTGPGSGRGRMGAEPSRPGTELHGPTAR